MINKNQKITLSIIVTAHNEGLIAHKTMLSIFSAIQLLNDISYEIIISIDNGDNETLRYFNKYKDTRRINVVQVAYKDLSKSRNNAALLARGEYLAYIDADDLMSANWLLEGYRLAVQRGGIIHPQYSITFGDDHLVWEKRDSNNKDYDTLCLIDNNLWDSPSIAARKIFIDHPYHPNGNGFGYEDKHFNSQTLASGIHHRVAPKTLLFVRRKITGSMLRSASADLVTVAKNDLLTYDRIRNLSVTKYIQDSPVTPIGFGDKLLNQSKRIALKAHHRAIKYDLYKAIVKPLRENRQNNILLNLNKKYPEWMIDSWKDTHKIDNEVFPAKELLKGLGWYNAENITPGIKYAQLVQQFSQKPDTLFFVPHLIKGGADMLFINYSTELIKQHPDWHVSMLQTEDKVSVWKDKLPKDIDFINLYETFLGLDESTQYRLLATLVTQNDIKRIIIGNSQLAYNFVSRYQTLIKALDIAVYCYAFGEEFDEEGRLWGHIHTGIPKIYPVIYRIITDNNNTVTKLEQEYAFQPEKFRVHYQPTANEMKPTTNNDNRPLRILWASRVCKQKRPDILKAVSNKLDQNEFTIDAYGQLEEGLTKKYFDDSRVHYKGPFNGSSSIPTEKYDVFIYTSEGDGVPNILQEMTAAGLPIIASNVGGIKEFIVTNKTGFLIDDHENITSYVTAVTELKNGELRQRLNDAAQDLLRSSFSRKTWENNIRKDFDR